MIDPNDVTNYKRSNDELLEFWLFCLFVRGKNADVQAQKLNEFLTFLGGIDTFVRHKRVTVDQALRIVKAGQYNSLVQAIMETILAIRQDADFLRKATVSDLEKIKGVGPKTARFFVLHTRPKSSVAVLDTHILNYLNASMDLKVPRATPGDPKKYVELEEAFLLQADFEGVDPAAFDLAIWKASRDDRPLSWREFL